jgi:hypothetical protein
VSKFIEWFEVEVIVVSQVTGLGDAGLTASEEISLGLLCDGLWWISPLAVPDPAVESGDELAVLLAPILGGLPRGDGLEEGLNRWPFLGGDPLPGVVKFFATGSSSTSFRECVPNGIERRRGVGCNPTRAVRLFPILLFSSLLW